MMELVLASLAMLGFSIVSESLWVYWSRCVESGRRHRVAASSAAISALSYFSIWIVVDDKRMIIPALAGNIIGAYLGMGKPIGHATSTVVDPDLVRDGAHVLVGASRPLADDFAPSGHMWPLGINATDEED